MRRSLVAATAALLIVLLAAGPAAATRRPAVATRAYCTALDAMLGRMGGSAATLRTRQTRRVIVAAMHGTPKAVARSADTLGRSLLKYIDHGPKSVHAAEKKRASKAGAALLAWGRRHCSAVREKVLAGSVESALRDGLTNAKAIYVDSDSYVGATPAALGAAEPALHFTAGPATPGDPKSISVHVADATHVVMAASTGTTCFYVSDDANGAGTQFAQVSERTCDAAAAPPLFTGSWK